MNVQEEGERSFNVVDRGCKNGAADALETAEFGGSVSGLVEIRGGAPMRVKYWPLFIS